jgi:hypothetical protein
MEPTRNQKSKTFTKEQKRFLYRTISKGAQEEYKRVCDSFKSYITDLTNNKLLTEDEIFMKSRPYIKKTKTIRLLPSDLGMNKTVEYPGHPNIKRGLEISYYLDEGIPSEKDMSVKYDSIKDFQLGPRIMEKCSPEEINFICDALREVAIKHLEYDYYGIDTGWIKCESSYDYFPGVSTWGALYKKSPEYFDILVENYYIEPASSKDKEADEFELLKDLIRTLST